MYFFFLFYLSLSGNLRNVKVKELKELIVGNVTFVIYSCLDEDFEEILLTGHVLITFSFAQIRWHSGCRCHMPPGGGEDAPAELHGVHDAVAAGGECRRRTGERWPIGAAAAGTTT